MEVPGYYEFFCPVRVFVGWNALRKLPDLMREAQISRPMLITDKGVTSSGLLRLVENHLPGECMPAWVYDQVPPDSNLYVISCLADMYRRKNCDSILAIGGGSVLDTAKGVNILVSEGGTDLRRYIGADVLRKRSRPLIAIPTTAGTGSEVTPVAVIKDHEKHRKVAFVSPFIYPFAAVVDPQMTLSLTPAITAATGMDAFTHAVEAYIGLQKNPLSDCFALESISLIGRFLLRAVCKPADREARLGMAMAATLGGVAFANSMVGIVHAVGHAIGSVCGVPHGICMAVLLPYGLEFNVRKRAKEIGQLLPYLGGGEKHHVPERQRAIRVISYIRQLNQDLHNATGGNHPRCLKEIKNVDGSLAVPKDAFFDIVETALDDGSLLYNPEEADYREIYRILESAWEGIPRGG